MESKANVERRERKKSHCGKDRKKAKSFWKGKKESRQIVERYRNYLLVDQNVHCTIKVIIMIDRHI